MRRPTRCKHCGYNYLIQVRLEPLAAGEKAPEQKCPKCGETA